MSYKKPHAQSVVNVLQDDGSYKTFVSNICFPNGKRLKYAEKVGKTYKKVYQSTWNIMVKKAQVNQTCDNTTYTFPESLHYGITI